MKYVLNSCFGGFGLSTEAYEWLIKNKGWKVTKYKEDNGGLVNEEAELIEADGSFSDYYTVKSDSDLEFRCNPDLVECVETLGGKAGGDFAALRIVECPHGPNDGIEIDEYDGQEGLQTIPETW